MTGSQAHNTGTNTLFLLLNSYFYVPKFALSLSFSLLFHFCFLQNLCTPNASCLHLLFIILGFPLSLFSSLYPSGLGSTWPSTSQQQDKT